ELAGLETRRKGDDGNAGGTRHEAVNAREFEGQGQDNRVGTVARYTRMRRRDAPFQRGGGQTAGRRAGLDGLDGPAVRGGAMVRRRRRRQGDYAKRLACGGVRTE